MARRRKKNAKSPPAETPPSPPTAHVATPLGALLKDVRISAKQHPAAHKRPPAAAQAPKASTVPLAKASTPETEPSPSARELRLLNDAYQGATPLAKAHGRVGQRAARKLSLPTPLSVNAAAEQAARERLGALVGGGVRFSIASEEGANHEAVREGVSRRELRRLRSPNFHAEATLDLHGETAATVELSVSRFVRNHKHRGCRYLLVIHGKGLHSESGRGVLGAAVFSALTSGGAAPLVRALAHAHPQLGGDGATAVMLM